MVLLASGIVDEWLVLLVLVSSVLPVLLGGVGVEPGCGWWQVGSWHTVGVLRDHALAGFLGASLAACLICVVGWVVLVGVVFGC